jgi:hypothetical protein
LPKSDDYVNLLKDIRTVVRKLDDLGKIKTTARKKYLLLLYAATSIQSLKIRGSFNKNDSYMYFSLYDLGEIAADRDNILHYSTSFDKNTANKVFEGAREENLVRYLPREDISKEICSGDTAPIAITKEGNLYCQNIIAHYLL